MEAHTHWLPYCGPAPGPGDWLSSWNFEPLLLAATLLALAAGLRVAPQRRVFHIAAAITVLVLFVSPLCAMGSALFTVRVIHHLALAFVLAPLLAQSLALRRLALGAALPALTVIQAMVFWAWHAPPLYEAALSSDLTFWVMQFSLTGTSAFWWAQIRRASAPAAVAAILATMVQMGALGALLTFADRAFYAPHLASAPMWGLTPLEDQQIAGLIMWAAGSAAYLLIALGLLYRSIGAAGPRPRQA